MQTDDIAPDPLAQLTDEVQKGLRESQTRNMSKREARIFSIDVDRFKEAIFAWTLQFKRAKLESGYSKALYKETTFLKCVQSSLVIFMVRFAYRNNNNDQLIVGVACVIRVYAETLGMLPPNTPVTVLAPAMPAMMVIDNLYVPDNRQAGLLAFWWIRGFQLVIGFGVWLAFHGLRNGRSTLGIKPSWAVRMATFLYVAATIVFVITPSWKNA